MAKTVLLTGDSIIKNITDWEYSRNNTPHLVTTECFRGCTTSRLKSKVERRVLKISGYDIIVIHIGTNDIANGATDILYQYKDLVDAIKQKTTWQK